MEAASRGTARPGGLVVGLLPGFEARDANRWVRVPIATGMDQAEIALALKLGRPVVGLGTRRLAQPEGRRGWPA